jgi:hypothetical protein
VKDLNPSEQVDKKSMLSRWKQFETPIALILSVLALLVSILSYRNSTALRYDVSVNMPPEALATLTDTDTGVPAYVVYRDIDDRSLGLSRVAIFIEIRITNLGTRPFSVAGLSAWVKQEVPPDADLSVTPESLPLTFDKVYDHLSDRAGRKLDAPLLVEPGDQRLVRLRFEIPLIDSMARYIFRGKKSVATEVFCKRFEDRTPKLFSGNQRFLGEFLDPELSVQIAQSTDSEKLPIHLCYVDVLQPGEEDP